MFPLFIGQIVEILSRKNAMYVCPFCIILRWTPLLKPSKTRPKHVRFHPKHAWNFLKKSSFLELFSCFGDTRPFCTLNFSMISTLFMLFSLVSARVWVRFAGGTAWLTLSHHKYHLILPSYLLNELHFLTGFWMLLLFIQNPLKIYTILQVLGAFLRGILLVLPVVASELIKSLKKNGKLLISLADFNRIGAFTYS